MVLQAQQCDGQNGWRIPKSNLGSLVFKSHAKKDGLIIYDRPDIARIIPKETKASETGQSKPAKKYTYSEAYHEYDQEPLSHTQVLGANRFPCRFIILTILRSLRTSTVERANHNHVMSVLLFFITQQEIQAKHSHKQFLQPLPAAQTPYEN